MPYSNSISSSIYSLSGVDNAMMMHAWILTGDASPATGDASPVASETYDPNPAGLLFVKGLGSFKVKRDRQRLQNKEATQAVLSGVFSLKTLVPVSCIANSLEIHCPSSIYRVEFRHYFDIRISMTTGSQFRIQFSSTSPLAVHIPLMCSRNTISALLQPYRANSPEIHCASSIS